MQFNKALFKFIKVAFTIMVILLIVYAGVRISKTAYDFGYRVFTETAIDKAPGKDVDIQVTDGMSAKKLGEELEAKGLQIRAYESDVNFILIKTDIPLYDRLLQKKILIRDCENFEGLSKGYYRIAVKLRSENEKLLKAIGECVERKVW